MTNISTILCADWGGTIDKRAVWEAHIGTRQIRRRECAAGWTLERIVEEARACAGPTLVTIDAPIGLPRSYVKAVAGSGGRFLSLMPTRPTEWFDAIERPQRWTLERPFFAVPGGKGALKAFEAEALALGVDLRRAIERTTKGKSVFIKAGIPGSVGTGACGLWRELQQMLADRDCAAVWPFHGGLSELLGSRGIVVGEIYPRAAYATALLDLPPAERPPLAVATTDRPTREAAVRRLQSSRWVRDARVVCHDLDAARGNEDDFDACMTAAALLRCQIAGTPLYRAEDVDPVAEGGILGTGSVAMDLAERKFVRDVVDRDRVQ